MAYRLRFLLTLLGQVVPLAAAYAFGIFAPNHRYRWVALLVAILFIIIAEYIRIYRPSRTIDDMRRRQFAFYFTQFADSAKLNGVPARIRVNIMFKRLTWRGWRFYQYYQYNMANWPDDDLNFPIKCGLCGLAFRQRSHDVVYYDKAQLDATNFGFSSEQLEKVKHVMAVATIPLSKEKTTWAGHIAYKHVGALNVDALDHTGELLLAEPEIHEQIRALAQFVQISIS
jgi:hypothetical protein